MVIRLLLRWAALAAAIGATAWLLPGLEVTGGVLTYLWVALLFALVNGILGPILHLISLPLTVVTLGLFALIVNAALLGITAALTDDLSVDGFWTAVLAPIVISIVTLALTWLIPDPKSVEA